jgi:hypothetical protein
MVFDAFVGILFISSCCQQYECTYWDLCVKLHAWTKFADIREIFVQALCIIFHGIHSSSISTLIRADRRTDGQTDRHDGANICFLPFIRTRLLCLTNAFRFLSAPNHKHNAYKEDLQTTYFHFSYLMQMLPPYIQSHNSRYFQTKQQSWIRNKFC